MMKIPCFNAAAVLFGTLSLAVSHAAVLPLPVDLEMRVESNLAVDERVLSGNIDVDVRNGIATLSGTVANLAAKRAAELIAASTYGLRDVRNLLEVSPSGRGDAAIRKDITDAFADDPGVDLYEVQVRVNDGNVLLTGLVASYTEKKLSEAIAASVYGVRRIQNQIEIHTTGELRPDYEIEKDVEGRLQVDKRLAQLPIEVNVADGTVFLSGAVETPLQRYWAAALGWVAGARDVNATAIEIAPVSDQDRNNRHAASANDSSRDPVQDAPVVESSESDIRKAVEAALRTEPVFGSNPPRVRVEDGTVTLTGVVPTVNAARRAEQIAAAVLEVWNVQNNVTTPVRADVANEILADRVVRAIERDAYLHDDRIRVTTRRGQTQLEGEVDSRYERQHLEEIVSRVNGVRSIDNNTAVEG